MKILCTLVLGFGLSNNSLAAALSEEVLYFINFELEKAGLCQSKTCDFSKIKELKAPLSELSLIFKEKSRNLSAPNNRHTKVKRLIQSIKADSNLKDYYLSDGHIAWLFEQNPIDFGAFREACEKYLDYRQQLSISLIVAQVLRYEIDNGSFSKLNTKKTLHRLKYLAGGSLFLASAAEHKYKYYPVPESLLLIVAVSYATVNVLMPHFFDVIYDGLLELYINHKTSQMDRAIFGRD